MRPMDFNDFREVMGWATSPESQPASKSDLSNGIADLIAALPSNPSYDFEDTPTVSIIPATWDSSAAFDDALPVSRQAVEDWHTANMIPLPQLFAPPEKKAPLTLTTANDGILKRKFSLNLNEISTFLVENADFSVIGDQLAYYSPPCWTLLTKDSAPQILSSLLRHANEEIANHLTSRDLSEISKCIQRSESIRRYSVLPPADPHLLCCSDAMYAWPEHKTRPHRPEDLRTSALNVRTWDISPHGTPFFDLFLDNVAASDDSLATLILEVIGVIISGYRVKHFFVFEGEPSSGKSQLARFLEDVLGPKSFFAVESFQRLTSNWVTGELPGKLLLTCADVPFAAIKPAAVGLIKQLTGDDPIYGEVKYKSPFTFFNTAKLLFLSNFPLRLDSAHADPALQDRMIRVPFRRSIPPENQIPDIHTKLLTEAGGIIWKALEALDAWEKRGRIFTSVELDNTSPALPPTQTERILQFVRCECALDETAITPSADLHARFQEFEAGQQLPSIGTSVFIRTLKKLGPFTKADTSTDRRIKGLRLISHNE